MVKRFLLSAAAVAAITGNAIAYDVITGDVTMPNELEQMVVDGNNSGPGAVIGIADSTNTGLIFPAYFAGDGWQSTLKIINTKDVPVVAKVVLFDKENSKEVKDFNIYLSAKDVFEADIKVDSDGKVKIISEDDSVSLLSGGMASAANPLKEEIDSSKGYIEVIPMVTFTKEAHGEKLRDAYLNFAEDVRRVQAGPLNFEGGVVKNQMVRAPYVDINLTFDTTNNITNCYNVDNTPGCDGNFTTNDIEGALSGYIRITDVINGKDMITNGFPVWFDTEDNQALVYLRGEKANLLDVAIYHDGINNVYSLADIRDSINLLYFYYTVNALVNEVYITYGEAPVENMYALITQPYKRIAIQQSILDGDAQNIISDFWPDTSMTGNTINYGTLKLVAHVYDNSENKMQDSQFSPATTPKILITQELGWTGVDATDSTKLPHYLMQAQSQGFNKGFVILKNSTGYWMPGFVTQMIATNAGGTTVTNWYWPTVR